MKKNLLFAIATLLTLSSLCLTQTGTNSKSKNRSENNLEQKLIDLEKVVWEAYKNKDVGAIKAHTAEDYATYTLDGPSNLQMDIASLPQFTIESYTVEDPKVTMATKDVAILRYIWNPKGTARGRSLTPVYATTVYVKRQGKWQVVSYQETPVNKAP